MIAILVEVNNRYSLQLVFKYKESIMKKVIYKGVGIGPKMDSGLMTQPYDFTSGSCMMEDGDALLLIQRCSHSYKFANEPVVESVTKPVVEPVVESEVVVEEPKKFVVDPNAKAAKVK